MRLLTALPTALLLLLAAVVAGCGEDTTDAAGGSEVAVVGTTTQVADFLRSVGGDRAEVRQIIPPNSDPHGYEPRPSDVEAVADAKLIVRSGGDLDDWLDSVIDNAGADAEVITLMDRVHTIEGDQEQHADGDEDHGEGEPDPHWWQDPRNAELAVEAIRDTLVKADPGGAATYRHNAERYLTRLERLDRQTADCIDQIPPRLRKLVTTHDALGYYANRYGLEVIGTVIPSLSTQAQPSVKDIEQLVDQIRTTGVKAIYPESSINSKLEQAVARESGATTGKALWADTLGPEGSNGATYIGSIAANTAALVDGLSGGKASCRPDE